MSDPRDPVTDRYRELARDEPPPHLDASILAASRRAVGAGPARIDRPASLKRWAGPVSIAAVLVLGIGVALRMQVEQPGIEVAVPRLEQRGAEAPSPPPATDVAAKPAPQLKAEVAAPAAEAPAPVAKATRPAASERRAGESTTVASSSAAPAPQALQALPPAESFPAPAAASPPPPQAMAADTAARIAPAQVPPPTQTTTTVSTPPPPLAAAAPRARAQEKREAGTDAAATPEAELDRIARLREAGRGAEADRALAELQRRFPDHRIPDAMWERVRPR